MFLNIAESIKAQVKFNSKGQSTLSKRAVIEILGLAPNDLVVSRMSATLIDSLAEFGFDADTFTADGVPDIALGLIATHYGIYKKDARLQTVRVAKYFATIGARVAVQLWCGWTAEAEPSTGNADELLKKFLEGLQELNSKYQTDSKKYQEELNKWQAVEPNNLQGLTDIAQAYLDAGFDNIKLIASGKSYTMTEWHKKEIGGTFSKSFKARMSRRLSEVFKQLKKESPKKIKVNDEGKKIPEVIVYSEADFPLLKTVYHQLLDEATSPD